MAEEEKEEEQKKGGLMRIIMMVLGVLALIGVGIGAGYFYLEENLLTLLQEIEEIIERKMKEAEAAKAEEEAANAGPQKKKRKLKKFITPIMSFWQLYHKSQRI